MARELITPVRLNRAKNRRILLQGSMRSDAIVIVGVGFQDPTQMHLAQNHDVIC
jgi:hypothetical protein